jgi:LPXTG-motif cell wall-anchored protein
MKRRSFLVTPAACAALVLIPAAAHADVVPAPPGQASGVALEVGSLLDISKTDASAGSGAPAAQASVIRLQGQPVLNLGGTQTGDGDTGGSLLDTGSSLPGRVQVAPWHAAADGSQGPTRHAKSSAAAARAGVPDVVDAGVLTSSSEASYTDQASSGTALSDGADVVLLDALRLNLLHSEVNSGGRGHSYLVGLNGTEIGTDDQLGASPLCSLTAPGLLTLSCLTASGGTAAPGVGGATSGTANVVALDPVVDSLAALNPVAAFTTAASSGGASATPIGAAPAPAPSVAGDETSRAVPPPAATTGTAGQSLARSTGRLPRTGANSLSLLASGMTALLGGLGLRRFRRRPASR